MPLRRALAALRFPRSNSPPFQGRAGGGSKAHFSRLHLSTWIILAFVAVVLFFLEVPGQMVRELDPHLNLGDWEDFCVHGWPLAYARRDEIQRYQSRFPAHDSCWAFPWEDASWSVVGAVVDLIVVVAFLVGCAWFFERRRRSRSRFLQFTLGELGLIVVALAAPCAYVGSLYRQHAEEVAAMEGDIYSYPGSETTFEIRPLGLTWLYELAEKQNWVIGEGRFPAALVGVGFEFPVEKARLSHLRRLKFLAAESRDGLEFLNGAPASLEALDLNFSFQAADLLTLARFTDLKALRLSFNDLGDEREFRHLSSLPELTVLDLSKSALTDAGAVYLKSLPQLRELDLSETWVTDEALDFLRFMPRLQALRLAETKITNAALRDHWQDLLELESLDLSDTAIDDAAVPYLSRLVKLRELRLNNNAVTDTAVEYLIKLRSLENLAIDFTLITADGREELKAAYPGLTLE